MQVSDAPAPRAEPPVSTPDLADAVRRLGRTSVLVVGDVTLDRYVYGEVDRISLEAPVPVLSVQREIAVPGGAGNIVRNLGALGAAVAFVSVVGDDSAGSELTGLVGTQPGVEPWLLVEGSRATTVKTRFIAQGGHQGHQLLRADHEETSPINPRLADRLMRIGRDAMAATSVTVLADYHKGVLAGDIPTQLIAAARRLGRRIVVDLRGNDYARYAGADVLLTSRRDLARACTIPPDSDDGFVAAAESVRRLHDIGAIMITSAEAGTTLVHDGAPFHCPVEATDVLDLSGAGDTTSATVAACLAAGLDLPTATRLATIAAGIVLGRIGTAVVREHDLTAALLPHSGALQKITAGEAAAERTERWRRRALRIGLVHGCFDPLRAGHIHLLEQARAACDRLIVGVYDDAIVHRDKGPDRPFQPEAVRAARLASLGCVDLVVVLNDADTSSLITNLRPDLLAGTMNPAEADHVRGYGGQILLAERLPEPSGAND
ncbi:PfkB family carbohydrate kinase [Rhodovastum atsumiense]|uniref:Bifunctional heptose 7-phosphate kinase/heptose 1-phosphate adenyltransferase n=1 Tax=Rhodovastum atsumiense TaxID=504468 RepID=A0A5M6ITE3_9PROT|nr:bifunctional heptose 7-phosphate kinase/heptose 1-phosphate adenyltransferase [Rhodovastum atsumiense]